MVQIGGFMTSDLDRKIAFICEVDRLKQVERRTHIIGGSRPENAAEHSWHIALMALVLAGYAQEPNIDLLKVLGMLLVHDIVEIDAGDTFLYDSGREADKVERERQAADRLFSILPHQDDRLLALWLEFEARETPEAKFAQAIDRFHPLLLNHLNAGKGVLTEGKTFSVAEVVARNSHIKDGAPALWEYALALIRQQRGAV